MNKKQSSKPQKPKLSEAAALHRGRIVGWLVTVLGLFGVLTYGLSPLAGVPGQPGDVFYLLIFAATALLGYFLLKFNAIAFGVFRFLLWLSVVVGGLYLIMGIAMIPLMFSMFASSGIDSLMGLMVLLGFLLATVSPIISLSLLIMTSSAEVRKLYR